MTPDTAMVLAAGLGTRMRHLSADTPKPLIELAGKPLLDHVLDRLAAAGVETAIVNVHYCADRIEAHLAGRAAPSIVISDERELLLDTGGGVAKALPALGGAPFFVHNSDSVWAEDGTANLERLAAHWDPERMDALLMVAPVADALGYGGKGDFDLDAEGRLSRRGADETVPYVFTGVSIMRPELCTDYPDGAFSLNLLWDRVLGQGRLHGVAHEGVWMHVGTPEALEQAGRYLEGGG